MRRGPSSGPEGLPVTGGLPSGGTPSGSLGQPGRRKAGALLSWTVKATAGVLVLAAAAYGAAQGTAGRAGQGAIDEGSGAGTGMGMLTEQKPEIDSAHIVTGEFTGARPELEPDGEAETRAAVQPVVHHDEEDEVEAAHAVVHEEEEEAHDHDHDHDHEEDEVEAAHAVVHEEEEEAHDHDHDHDHEEDEVEAAHAVVHEEEEEAHDHDHDHDHEEEEVEGAHAVVHEEEEEAHDHDHDHDHEEDEVEAAHAVVHEEEEEAHDHDHDNDHEEDEVEGAHAVVHEEEEEAHDHDHDNDHEEEEVEGAHAVVHEEEEEAHDHDNDHGEEEVEGAHAVVHEEEEEAHDHDHDNDHEEEEVEGAHTHSTGDEKEHTLAHIAADSDLAADDAASSTDDPTTTAETTTTNTKSDKTKKDAGAPAKKPELQWATCDDYALPSPPPSHGHKHHKPQPQAQPSGSHSKPHARSHGDVRRSWVYRTSSAGLPDNLGYVHMPTIAYVPSSDRLYVAWQGAKSAEGNNDQNIYYATSASMGQAWTKPKRLGGKQTGARWAPVLFLAPAPERHSRRGKASSATSLRLFYAESKNCYVCSTIACKNIMTPRLKVAQASEKAGVPSGGYSHLGKENPIHNPLVSPQWKPGGDIYVEELVSEMRWSGSPTLVLAESTPGGNVPKVIANPPAVTKTGNWVLPYWREVPRGMNLSPACMTHQSKEEFAGVVTTNNNGRSWHTYGQLKVTGGKLPMRQKDKPDWLIEASIVPLYEPRSNELLQLFRSSRDVAYASASLDGGKTWSEPQSTPLANPNSKLNAIRIPHTGHLVIAYNNHGFREGKRSNLVVAVSRDEGKSWTELAKLETQFVHELYYHYPSLAYAKGKLFVVYAVFGKGIRLASLDLDCAPPVS